MSELAPPEECSRFLPNHGPQVLNLLNDTFAAYEANCRKGKHNQSEVTSIQSVMRAALMYLGSQLRIRERGRQFASMIEHQLYKENKHRYMNAPG
jgi:hypothetical protein